VWASLAAFARLAGPAAPEDWEGKKITAVFFEPRDQPLTRDQIGLALRLRPGDLFDSRLLQQSIERLFATGRYDDIRVEAEADGTGARLTFYTVPGFFFGRIAVEGGKEPPSAGQLAGATKLETGEPYDEAELAPAAARLKDVLRANGFQSAEVRWETSRRAETEEVDIRFVLNTGQRARFTRPLFQGDLQRGELRLMRATAWQKWWGVRGYKEVTEARVQTGLDRLRALYRNREHLLAQVTLERLEYDPAANTVRPILNIQAGPRVFVRTEGARVRKGTLRQLVPIYQERTVDRDLLVEGRSRLLEHFQAQGYFEAKIDFERQAPTLSGDETILYRIARGPRSKMVRLSVEGAAYFDEATIRDRMNVQPATRLRYRRGRYSKPMLDEDLDSIAELYRANGFRDVKATSRVENNYRGKPQEMAVFVKVEEGPQWLVSSLELSGVDLKLIEEIQSILSSQQGQPFSTASLLTDRDAVLGWYFNNGYPEAIFDYIVTPDEQPQRMKVKYVVQEGRRNFVRQVLVNGLGRTNPRLVDRRIVVQPADPLSQASIVDSQRRLYDLGIFAKVDVAVQNPEGRERNKYVLFHLEEARRYAFNFGLGAELTRIGGGATTLTAPVGNAGFSPRLSVGVTRLNFLNIGHTAGVLTRLSRIQQRVLLNYLAPQFLGDERYNLTISTLGDISRDVNTFTSRRVEGAVQLGQRVTRANSMQYRFVYRLVRVDEGSLKIDPALIPLLSQPVRVGVASVTFLQDRRDDPLDSKRGMFTSIDFGAAGRPFGSQTAYARAVARNSSYHRVGRDILLARTFALGWLYNLGSRPIPLPERFFGGGATTHRGFPENQAGPRDPITGFPIGGNTYLFHGTELRFPLIGRTLGGVLFHDAGNVYSSLDNVTLRTKQRDLRDFDYMVHAVGFGVRFRTPIGPVRFDTGYSPNSPRFQGYEGTLEDLLRGAGRPGVIQRVSRIQFHFSLGQTF
jgi:outer membrane protein assembly complex protein YaeT